MPDHPNAEIIRKMTEAMQSGRPEVMGDVLADDVVWHEIGRDEPVHGLAALRERFAGGGASQYTFEGSLHDVIGGDDHTVALINATVTRGDQRIDYRVAEIYHVKDGKITERWAMSDDTQRINEFFSDWPA